MSLKERIEPLLLKVQKPARYTGGELNSIMKDKSEIKTRIALCFPDNYEIGMSHLGLKILYHTLNTRPDTYCERVFAPWDDMEQEMRKYNMPLFALETGDSVRDFDILGFTLQYELSYSNIVNMLDLAGIPVLAKDRDESYPIISCGGPCAYNAEPMAEIFDFMMLGEGEEQIHEVMDVLKVWKNEGKKSKTDLLERLCKIDGNICPLVL